MLLLFIRPKADDVGHHSWIACTLNLQLPGVLMTRMMVEKRVATKSVSPATTAGPLSAEELNKIDAYWRACNYLAAGMIYLRENPLLREPLKAEHIKTRLLGHWGAS